MPIDAKSDPSHPRSPIHQLNLEPPLRPQRGASLEALGRLAQEIARILQRLRTEGPGRVDHAQRGD